MIKIFCGDNRVRAKEEIEEFLGRDYEIVEGAELIVADLPSLLKGNSLFEEKRNILVRDLSVNRRVFEKIIEYLDTKHNVAIFELKLDKRGKAYRTIKDKVEIKEFNMPKNPNLGIVFDIYKTAKNDGIKAIKMLDKICDEEEPIMFLGLIVSQALKDYKNNPGIKEKRALKELSKLDLEIKTTSFEPWILVRSFLLRLSLL